MDTLSKRGHSHQHDDHSDIAMEAYAEKYEQEYKLDKPVRIIVVGAGNRGKVYSTYAVEHPARCKV